MEAPLAERIRPQKLSDYISQLHLVGPNGSLTQQIEKGIIPSLILWGPPGTGKTYNISSEAEKIINSAGNTSAITREEKFNRICESVRNISGIEIKANSLYRSRHTPIVPSRTASR